MTITPLANSLLGVISKDSTIPQSFQKKECKEYLDSLLPLPVQREFSISEIFQLADRFNGTPEQVFLLVEVWCLWHNIIFVEAEQIHE